MGYRWHESEFPAKERELPQRVARAAQRLTTHLMRVECLPMKKRTAAGRPKSPEGRVTLNLTLPPWTVAWLKATGNASECVRAFVDSEISQRRGKGQSERDVWNDVPKSQRNKAY